MSVFVDTNVLLRSVQPSHPMHDVAARAVAGLLRDGEVLVVTPQIVAKFWNVVTRPIDKNGLGLSPHSDLEGRSGSSADLRGCLRPRHLLAGLESRNGTQHRSCEGDLTRSEFCLRSVASSLGTLTRMSSYSPRQKRVLLVSILASFVSFLDGFIVNVALPAIARDLGGGLTAQQWIVNAYLLTLGSAHAHWPDPCRTCLGASEFSPWA